MRAFQFLKGAMEFAASTWLISSVWNILPFFPLPGKFLILWVSADLTFPNPHDQGCTSELWLLLYTRALSI